MAITFPQRDNSDAAVRSANMAVLAQLLSSMMQQMNARQIAETEGQYGLKRQEMAEAGGTERQKLANQGALATTQEANKGALAVAQEQSQGALAKQAEWIAYLKHADSEKYIDNLMAGVDAGALGELGLTDPLLDQYGGEGFVRLDAELRAAAQINSALIMQTQKKASAGEIVGRLADMQRGINSSLKEQEMIASAGLTLAPRLAANLADVLRKTPGETDPQRLVDQALGMSGYDPNALNFMRQAGSDLQAGGVTPAMNELLKSAGQPGGLVAVTTLRKAADLIESGESQELAKLDPTLRARLAGALRERSSYLIGNKIGTGLIDAESAQKMIGVVRQPTEDQPFNVPLLRQLTAVSLGTSRDVADFVAEAKKIDPEFPDVYATQRLEALRNETLGPDLVQQMEASKSEYDRASQGVVDEARVQQRQYAREQLKAARYRELTGRMDSLIAKGTPEALRYVKALQNRLDRELGADYQPTQNQTLDPAQLMQDVHRKLQEKEKEIAAQQAPGMAAEREFFAREYLNPETAAKLKQEALSQKPIQTSTAQRAPGTPATQPSASSQPSTPITITVGGVPQQLSQPPSAGAVSAGEAAQQWNPAMSGGIEVPRSVASVFGLDQSSDEIAKALAAERMALGRTR